MTTEETNTEAKEEEVLKTEVTSIAEEEKKTGKKIELPDDEEMKARAMQSFIISTQVLNNLFPKLSTRAKNRVFNAIMSLPEEGVPVFLKTDDEKQAFALGQRALSDRFLLTYYHVMEQARADRKAKLEEENKSKEEPKGEENEQSKE